MNLLPLHISHIPLVADWLSRQENYRWLDFGGGRQILDAMTLKIMTQRPNNYIRLFCSENEEAGPIGVVGLSNIARELKTAEIWYVLGDRRFSQQGHSTRAVSKLLQAGFTELGLDCVFAWAVETNEPSIRILKKNHFRPIGVLRRGHRLDGAPVDRLLFDLLASEYRPLEDPRLVSLA